MYLHTIDDIKIKDIVQQDIQFYRVSLIILKSFDLPFHSFNQSYKILRPPTPFMLFCMMYVLSLFFVFLVDKMNHMVGSYGPKKELQSYTTPPEEVPSGMLARGHYTNKSLFTDDDKNEHLKWEWNLEIKKDWKD